MFPISSLFRPTQNGQGRSIAATAVTRRTERETIRVPWFPRRRLLCDWSTQANVMEKVATPGASYALAQTGYYRDHALKTTRPGGPRNG